MGEKALVYNCETELARLIDSIDPNIKNEISEKGMKVDDRKSPRLKFYRTEGIKVSLDFDKKKLNCTCIDISPEGAGLLCEVPLHELNMPIGSIVNLTFTAKNSEKLFTAGMVCSKKQLNSFGKTLSRIGVSYVLTPQDKKKNLTENKRVQSRFALDEFSQPHAWCEHPVLFSEKLNMRVVEVSARGMKLKISKKNPSIFNGVKLPLHICIPGAETFLVPVTVKHCVVSADKDTYEFGAEYEKNDPVFLRELGKYILQFCKNVHPSQLSEQGFLGVDLSSALTFRYINSLEEMQEVLQLRLKAHQFDGRYAGEESPTIMTDEFDQYSRQIIALAGDRIVGAMRMVFVEGDKSRSELHRRHPLPSEVLNSKFIECSKLVLLPEYRGSGIFRLFLQEVLRISYEGGFERVIIEARDDIAPMYQKFGMTKLGIKVKKIIKNTEYYVNYMCLDMKTASTIPFRKLPLWNEVALPVLENVVAVRKTYEPTMREKVSMKLGKITKPLTNIAVKRYLKNKDKKKIKKNVSS